MPASSGGSDIRKKWLKAVHWQAHHISVDEGRFVSTFLGASDLRKK
jgi:hypothetical protein